MDRAVAGIARTVDIVLFISVPFVWAYRVELESVK